MQLLFYLQNILYLNYCQYYGIDSWQNTLGDGIIYREKEKKRLCCRRAAKYHSTLSQGVADDREGSTGIMYAMLRDKVCDFVSFFETACVCGLRIMRVSKINRGFSKINCGTELLATRNCPKLIVDWNCWILTQKNIKKMTGNRSFRLPVVIQNIFYCYFSLGPFLAFFL